MSGRSRKRAATSFLEILLLGLAALAVVVPLSASLWTTNHEAMASQDYMLAEAVCQRHLNALLAEPFEAVLESLPIRRELRGIPPGDEELCRKYPEYARAVAGSEGFRGELTAAEIEPGLIRVQVTLRWPVRPGSPHMREYGLVRLHQQWDTALRTRYELSEGQKQPTPPAERLVDR